MYRKKARSLVNTTRHFIAQKSNAVYGAGVSSIIPTPKARMKFYRRSSPGK